MPALSKLQRKAVRNLIFNLLQQSSGQVVLGRLIDCMENGVEPIETWGDAKLLTTLNDRYFVVNQRKDNGVVARMIKDEVARLTAEEEGLAKIMAAFDALAAE
jgi:hypothetical protein